MSETTTLPAVGKVKTAYVYAGFALVAGIAGYAWWRRSQDTGPSVADPTYVDTRTGSDLPSSGYVNPAPDNADGQSGTGIGGDSVWKAPNTDQEWAQQAIERLTWYEPGYVSSVTGKYLARQPIDSTEANVVREAWAQIGQPPGRQPIVPKSTGTGVTPTPKPTTPTMKAPTGLKASRVDRTGVRLDWAPLTGVKGYALYQNGKRLESVVYSGTYVSGLKSNTKYTFRVYGIYGSSNKLGPGSATITVRTKK